jgi:hypothetical protein
MHDKRRQGRRIGRLNQRAGVASRQWAFETLESRLAMAGLVINEFLASNTTGLQDEDGARSDWIELKNTAAAPMNVAGWHLTDDENDLDKWTLPAIDIPAGGYLLVFASDKDRTIVGQNLHTNFSLNDAGEYLALVQPGGVTIEDAYAPFPAQAANVSYGLGTSTLISEALVGETSPVKVFVPTTNTIDTSWYLPSFSDAGWTTGLAGVGFDNNTSGVDYNPLINVNVGAQMSALRTSAYMRMPFEVVNPDDLVSLTLRIRYDDGFFVYLNGTEIIPARRNAPATPSFNSAATTTHDDNLAIQYEDVDLSEFQNLLTPGTNVLAIHGLNRTAGSTDFLISPLLIAERPSGEVIGYMASPTPGAVNQQGTLGLVADTNFSVDRGLFTSPFQVEITTATSGATIRYTTDGSLPTETTGLIYNPASPPLIAETTTLRAAAFRTGWTPTNVDTQTYIFLDDVILQSGAGLAPVAPWGENGPDWEMDPVVVNNPTYASTIRDDLKDIPTVSLVMPWNDWFGGSGQGIYPTASEIERAVSMEYFTADGTSQFQIDAGIEIQGGTSDDRWKMDKLSMRVKFKAPYGPEKLNAEVYNDSVLDVGAATEFNTFILDAHLGYTWAYGGPAGSTQRVNAMYVQDAYVSDLQNLAGGAAPHSTFVHVYINGLYWGVYDMHERADEHFAESYLGGNDEDYDVIKHRASTEVSGIDLNPDPSIYVSSAITNYAAFLGLVRQNMTIQANYDAVAAKLDVDDFISYMIVNYYVGNDDWAHQNWYASFNRVDPEGKWRYHSWDAENVLKDVNRDSTTLNNTDGPTEVLQRLIVNPEFRLRFNDMAQKLMRNDGLLTSTKAAEIYQTRADGLGRALVGESARWGDSRTVPHSFGPAPNDPVGIGNPYLLSHWTTRNNFLYSSYFPNRTNNVLNQFVARTWATTLAAPAFTNYGGTVEEGTQVTISKPAGSPVGGTLYYTLDGSDPRAVGGGVASGAIAVAGNSTVLTINAGTHVRARVFDAAQSGTSNDWSAEIDAMFLLETPFPLRITELHYNPAAFSGVADAQDLEFIELTNTGSSTISLDGIRITEFSNTGFTFPNGLTLGAGERIIVSRSPSIFTQAYGTGVTVVSTGYFDQNLSNGGERIALHGPLGEVLQDFSYDDAAGWPTAPDGNGKSLEIIDPLGDPSSASNWRASYYIGGSPGSEGLPPSIAGDFNGDGKVNGRDFLVWQRGLGTPALQADAEVGDADGDRDVDGMDLGVWQANYGVPSVAAFEDIDVASYAMTRVALHSGGVETSVLPGDAWILLHTLETRRTGQLIRAAQVDEALSTLTSRRPVWTPARVALTAEHFSQNTVDKAIEDIDGSRSGGLTSFRCEYKMMVQDLFAEMQDTVSLWENVPS